MLDRTLEEEIEAQFASLWQGALNQYPAASGKHLADADIPKPTTLQSLMAEIDIRNQQFGDFRKSRQTLFQTLEMALKPVKLISNMAAGIASQASVSLAKLLRFAPIDLFYRLFLQAASSLDLPYILWMRVRASVPTMIQFAISLTK